MKELRTLTEGYPRAIDYTLTLQQEMLFADNSMFSKLGVDLVLAGCDITDNGNGTANISAGVVYLGGEILRFDAAANVTLDGTAAMIKGNYVTTDPKQFRPPAGIKDIYREAKAIIGAYATPSQLKIEMRLRNLQTHLEDIVTSKAFRGEKKVIIDLDGDFLTKFDASGLGAVAPFIGWHLANGNAGLPNYAGRAGVGAGKFTSPLDGAEIDFVAGLAGGSDRHTLSVNEMPEHNHNTQFNECGRPSSSNSGNVLAFTNSANQGARSFNSNSKGSNAAHNNMSPYIVEYVIIKL